MLRLFLLSPDCLHVRRLLSPETMEEFLVSLSGVKGVALGQGFSVRSHSCKIYEDIFVWLFGRVEV